MLPWLALLGACFTPYHGSDVAEPDTAEDDTGAAPDSESDPSDTSSPDTSPPDSDTPPPDTDSGPDTSPPDTDTGPAPQADEACYLGQNRAGTTCLPVDSPASMPSGYNYPPPLSGSSQYRAPQAWLDLQTADPALQLAPNFRLDEMAQLHKGRYAVVQPHAVERLQALRDTLGPLVINSGYRSPAYNASVGGVTNSRHMFGDAFDLDPVNVTVQRLSQECYAEGAGYVGVYDTFAHCDWRDDLVDPVFFDGDRRAALVATWPHHDARVERAGQRMFAPAEGWDEGEPLREWTAFDAEDRVIATAEGESFVAPYGTARVQVIVGMLVAREISL